MVRFLTLAFGITWILVSPLVLSERGLLPPIPPWLHGLGALGPVLAAYFSPRDHGVFQARGPSRMSRAAMALCLATPPLFVAVALGVAAARGEPILAPLSVAVGDPSWLASLAAGSVLYGFGEEPGWRGWLQTHLQQDHSVFVATLLLSPVWALWHLPFFFYRFDFGGPATVVGFFVGLLAGAFWLAFLFDATGSVVMVAVWHVLWNVANLALATVSDTAVAVLNALMMVLGFGVGIGLALRARAPDRAV